MKIYSSETLALTFRTRGYKRSIFDFLTRGRSYSFCERFSILQVMSPPHPLTQCGYVWSHKNKVPNMDQIGTTFTRNRDQLGITFSQNRDLSEQPRNKNDISLIRLRRDGVWLIKGTFLILDLPQENKS